MNYSESTKILEEIKKAKKILLNCHRGPDSDSIGGATALAKMIKSFKKEVVIICPSQILPELKFIEGSSEIITTDFSRFKFEEFDLFIALDSSTWGMVSGSERNPKPHINMIVVDHHSTNKGFGDINLIDSATTSTSELLYRVFQDWDVDINKSIAECLLTGIIGDTGAFQYQGVGKRTLEIAGDLIDKGADKDKIIANIYRNIDFMEVKLWGEIIKRMNFEKESRFIWSAVPLSLYKEFGELAFAKEDAANLFFPIVRDTDFGIVMVEIKENYLSVSLRSRNKFDVSKIAEEIGGGGHKAAAGAKIENLSFDKAVEKVLATARKYAQKTS